MILKEFSLITADFLQTFWDFVIRREFIFSQFTPGEFYSLEHILFERYYYFFYYLIWIVVMVIKLTQQCIGTSSLV